MKFNLEDCSVFMSHLLLEDINLAEEVSHTTPWVDDQTLVATLQINGVDVPAEHMEAFMKSLWQRCKDDTTTGYEKLKRAQDDFDNVLEKLVDMQNALHTIEDTIKPYCER